MKFARRFVLSILAIFLLLMVACEGAEGEKESKQEEENTNVDIILNEEESLKNDGVENSDESKSGQTSNADNGQNDQVESTNDVNGEELQESNSTDLTENQREKYLQKLNEMEEADRYEDAGTSMIELEEQEKLRYEKWDKELNEIYGILQEQLSEEEMAKLREEQRNWITYRDETAKESSLKYEGGSYESLEYVATQATLTRDRCYLLVSKYMK